MKAVFFGTPEIAASCLEELLNIGVEIVCVVTRADKPQGRGYKMDYSPVKKLALEKQLRIYQPNGLRNQEAQAFLASLGADVFFTVAYGRIFPKEVLDIPPMGCVNVHASLLPYLRGASPINRAIINGDTHGGVTIMFMDEGVDTGDTVLTKETDIPYDMDFGTYYGVITDLGRKALADFVPMLENGAFTRTKQDHSKATFAPKVEKEETLLDFTLSSTSVYNKIRGLSPAPCAYTFFGGKRCKIYKANPGDGNGEAGTVIRADKNGIEVACGDKSIIITQLQPEGKSVMEAKAFLAGNKVI